LKMIGKSAIIHLPGDNVPKRGRMSAANGEASSRSRLTRLDLPRNVVAGSSQAKDVWSIFECSKKTKEPLFN
jgi:hypothetical protein